MRLFLIGFLFSFSPLLAQPAFDAASIRKNLTETNSGSLSREGGRLTLTNTSLRDCIAFAYNIPTGRDYELSGPAWLDTEKFDVMATFPLETSRERYREMLQTMLAERFGLKNTSKTESSKPMRWSSRNTAQNCRPIRTERGAHSFSAKTTLPGVRYPLLTWRIASPAQPSNWIDPLSTQRESKAPMISR